MAGLLQMKDRFKPGDVVVVIFHDHGSRYLGKMFNDDWMRERGFLEEEKPKAIDIVNKHKHLPLITVDENATMNDAVEKFVRFNISQLPVVNQGKIVGSLSDNFVYNLLIKNPDIRSARVGDFMQPPFPIVDKDTKLDQIISKINKDNRAVLVKINENEYHIITLHDLIERCW
jgi:cystathionine beta-synthase